MTHEEAELRKALKCLRLEAPESVCADIEAKAMAALAAEREACAKKARSWVDSCGERECGHTLDMVPEEIATMILESD